MWLLIFIDPGRLPDGCAWSLAGLDGKLPEVWLKKVGSVHWFESELEVYVVGTKMVKPKWLTFIEYLGSVWDGCLFIYLFYYVLHFFKLKIIRNLWWGCVQLRLQPLEVGNNHGTSRSYVGVMNNQNCGDFVCDVYGLYGFRLWFQTKWKTRVYFCLLVDGCWFCWVRSIEISGSWSSMLNGSFESLNLLYTSLFIVYIGFAGVCTVIPSDRSLLALVWMSFWIFSVSMGM